MPISDLELSKESDTIKEAYSAFTAFYKSILVDNTSCLDWLNKVYKDRAYLILQNHLDIYTKDKVYYSEKEIDEYVIDQINIAITDDTLKQKLLIRHEGKLAFDVLRKFGPNENVFSATEKRKVIETVHNFRPKIIGNHTPLYLNKKYSKILGDFLWKPKSSIEKSGLLNSFKPRKQAEERITFLENFVKIWVVSSDLYLVLNSYPNCSSITFDKNFEYAKIEFTMPDECGEAILKKDNGIWSLISSRIIWVE